MANTKKLSKEERKKAKRTSRKKVKTEKPLKPREYARGSKKRKVKKMVRGTAKTVNGSAWHLALGLAGQMLALQVAGDKALGSNSDHQYSTTESSPRTSDNQLFCCKSIDKLISDSEEPERRLKKTLGPVSLTALGIGAVIGSGIFTVIGTAIGGQKFDTSSILNAPLLDFLITHHASLGRPGAGPALALSLVLVAIVCAFTGLCYAELASMIPIAGSAYTYTYATMGELIAWIIGWDLILEYAVSNMAVSVGFSAHLVGMFDWFGFHPALRWISPAYLPGGLTDLKGNVLYTPGLHFGFNFPAFLVVMILTVILVRGIRESAEANNVMVLLKIAAILAFVIVGAHYVHPGNWHPFAPNGMVRNPDRRLDYFLYLHWI